MLIDQFLPEYHFTERHEIEILATTESVYKVVRVLNLRHSVSIRWLFKLRGLPASALSLEGLQKIGFAVLGETPNQEILLGIVGCFWTLKGDLRLIDAEGFKSFNKAGYAKAVWGFQLKPQTETITQVVTETRIHCLDERSLRRFRPYWILVRPFSAWIRREALRIIKEKAESQHSLPATTDPAQQEENIRCRNSYNRFTIEKEFD